MTAYCSSSNGERGYRSKGGTYFDARKYGPGRWTRFLLGLLLGLTPLNNTDRVRICLHVGKKGIAC